MAQTTDHVIHGLDLLEPIRGVAKPWSLRMGARHASVGLQHAQEINRDGDISSIRKILLN